jgi:hypothetical protein
MKALKTTLTFAAIWLLSNSGLQAADYFATGFESDAPNTLPNGWVIQHHGNNDQVVVQGAGGNNYLQLVGSYGYSAVLRYDFSATMPSALGFAFDIQRFYNTPGGGYGAFGIANGSWAFSMGFEALGITDTEFWHSVFCTVDFSTHQGFAYVDGSATPVAMGSDVQNPYPWWGGMSPGIAFDSNWGAAMGIDNILLGVVEVPEPSVAALALLGSLALLWRRRN